MLFIVNAVVCRLVSVTVREALGVPTAKVVLYVKVAGETVTAAVPVPVTTSDCGLPAPL